MQVNCTPNVSYRLHWYSVALLYLREDGQGVASGFELLFLACTAINVRRLEVLASRCSRLHLSLELGEHFGKQGKFSLKAHRIQGFGGLSEFTGSVHVAAIYSHRWIFSTLSMFLWQEEEGRVARYI